MGEIIDFKEAKMARAHNNYSTSKQTAWRLDKTISLTVVISLIGFTITGIVYAVGFKQDMDRLKDLPERVARMEQQIIDIKNSTNRIETHLLSEGSR
jgi:hypothetical protein